ncbi:MAG: hypothetical protein BGN85_06155 [Alphaproteobacteria bacterium 64-11]|nr:YdeI/OmpD-associated family protein [Alphaproteobacteria bacterium]OJU08898.1 MAG: hypothetical protein BGN85_06155 [Alphaproteobacteria bacterium 64-11]
MAEKAISGGVVHDLPGDMRKALGADATALAAWQGITPLARNEWICWVTIVKNDETRKEHVQRLVAQLKEGMRRPCCWPGCPHRNPKAKKWFGAKRKKAAKSSTRRSGE